MKDLTTTTFARPLTFNHLSKFYSTTIFDSYTRAGGIFGSTPITTGSATIFNSGSTVVFKEAGFQTTFVQGQQVNMPIAASAITFEAKPYMKPVDIIPGVAPAGNCGPCAGPIIAGDLVIVPSAASFAGIIPLEQVTLNNGESFIIEFLNSYITATDFILTNAIKGGYLNTAVRDINEGPPAKCQILVTNVHATDNLTLDYVEIAFMLIGSGSTHA